jgi:hypothetical protein
VLVLLGNGDSFLHQLGIGNSYVFEDKRRAGREITKILL